MTREEMKSRLEYLQEREFFINMADRLSVAEWEALDRIHAEERALMEALSKA